MSFRLFALLIGTLAVLSLCDKRTSFLDVSSMMSPDGTTSFQNVATLEPGKTLVLGASVVHDMYRMVVSTTAGAALHAFCGDQGIAAFEELTLPTQSDWLGPHELDLAADETTMSCNFVGRLDNKAADPGYMTLVNEGTKKLTIGFLMLATTPEYVTLRPGRNTAVSVATGDGVDHPTAGLVMAELGTTTPRSVYVSIREQYAAELTFMEVNTGEAHETNRMWLVTNSREYILQPYTTALLGAFSLRNSPYGLVSLTLDAITDSIVTDMMFSSGTNIVAISVSDEQWLRVTVPEQDGKTAYLSETTMTVSGFDTNTLSLAVLPCHVANNGECTDKVPPDDSDNYVVPGAAPYTVNFLGRTDDLMPWRSGIYWVHFKKIGVSQFPVNIQVTVTGSICPKGTAGPNCASTIVPAPAIANTKVTLGDTPTVFRLDTDLKSGSPAHMKVLLTASGHGQAQTYLGPAPQPAEATNLGGVQVYTLFEGYQVTEEVASSSALLGDGAVFLTVFGDSGLTVTVTHSLASYCGNGAVDPTTGLCKCDQGFSPVDGCTALFGDLQDSMDLTGGLRYSFDLGTAPFDFMLHVPTGMGASAVLVIRNGTTGETLSQAYTSFDSNGDARFLAPFVRERSAVLTVNPGPANIAMTRTSLINFNPPPDNSNHTDIWQSVVLFMQIAALMLVIACPATLLLVACVGGVGTIGVVGYAMNRYGNKTRDAQDRENLLATEI
ncbi:hypothetical protein J8273_7282 [Carpediemonas membranifera]|uniref:Uncharacterized protein n=1 Tax=Carpediemonas membranifera TaxID=201153 RepID=A0A8J6AXR5_9EUKA|nr:hypothetical protein J8273_7282 [Carpediemonas membranifera]|eukprot:KAG9391008.1 hypothetical protein J8273_7282 [Carpediemonas membranifera]